MSFPRARIQRFNDIKVCTPSKVKDIIKSVAPQKDKFVIQKSPSVSSAQSTPCFRTPNLPVKKKAPSSAIKSKCLLFENENDLDVLKEKIVECKNKDEYINDLMEQLEDMKTQIFTLKQQKALLENNKVQFEEQLNVICKQHTEKIAEVKEKYEGSFKKIFVQFQALLDEVKLNKEFLKILKLEYDKSKSEIENDIGNLSCTLKDYVDVLQKEVQIKEEKTKQLDEELTFIKQEYDTLKLNHSKEIKSLNKQHEDEVRDLEFEMLKTVSELRGLLDKESLRFDKIIAEIKEEKSEEVKTLHQKLENDANILKQEYEAKIKQIEENCSEVKILMEIQCNEKCKDIEETWKLKLADQEAKSDAILKECQAISEYNIIQCELEKYQAQQELAGKIKELEDMKQKTDMCASCKFLADKYNALEMDLTNKIKKLIEEDEILKIELNMYKSQLDQVLGEKKIYEITINKTLNTVETLKNRLLESDRDVEHMKRELEQCEIEKLMYENKSSQLMEELQVVLQLYEDLEIQQENHVIITKDHVHKIEKQLKEKVDTYKHRANESLNNFVQALREKDVALNIAINEKMQTEAIVQDLREKLTKKESDLYETLEQLHEQQKVTADVQVSLQNAIKEFDCLESNSIKIASLKETIKHKDDEIYNLKLSVKDLESEGKESSKIEDLYKQINQLKDKSKSYHHHFEYYKNKAAEYEEEIADLSKINKKYIDQSGKYDALLQKCETLEKKSNELEEKVKEQEELLRNMKNQGDAVNKMLDYKEQNSVLIDEKTNLEKKVTSQNKLIEKLKKEVASFRHSPKKLKNKAEKENVNSPSRLLNTSSHHVGSPLKERN